MCFKQFRHTRQKWKENKETSVITASHSAEKLMKDPLRPKCKM